MLVVAFVSFSLFNFVGDPINNMVGEETSDEERAELRETLGLMDPIHVQFSRFIVNASKGEFGISYQLRRPVSELIVERLPATIELVVISFTPSRNNDGSLMMQLPGNWSRLQDDSNVSVFVTEPCTIA